MVIQLLVRLMLLLWLRGASAARVTTASVAKPGCNDTCGNVTIPFPFGIGPLAGCSANENFTITCNNSQKPFLTSNDLEVLDISVERGTVQVLYPVLASECPNPTNDHHRVLVNLSSPFTFSQTYSLFTATGSCDYQALMRSQGGKLIGGCFSFCSDYSNNQGFCQATIPTSLNFIDASFKVIDEPKNTKDCKYAFIMDRDWYHYNFTYDMRGMERVPATLAWPIQGTCESFSNMSESANDSQFASQLCKAHHSFCAAQPDYDDYYYTSTSSYKEYQCECNSGYEGNPYVSNGCQAIRGAYIENIKNNKKARIIIIGISTGVIGILLLLGGTWWLYKFVKRRKKLMLKQKFFKRNGGLLLQQQLSSGDEGNVEKTKLYTLKELEKATDRFNENRILGQGGQGTVYKGMLTDGRIVAVKKSKIVDKGNLEQFINEVVILSQINHRNVVKLHGCCLEAEVPLLVYEFIPNGTLYQYIHEQNEEFPLTWDIRVRVAIEVAGALSYLHSAASMPIYHRDIKSTNILLDEKFRAKVSDFGTSRSISIDQTHMTTLVQGTVGYLDPEYFQSSQFTDKSDVYSFGVVLVELLTGKKPISSAISEECRSLATYFILTMKENRLFDILDARVSTEGGKDEIMRVANLAKRCLNLSGRKRPTMKEVAIELEGIRMSYGVSTLQQNAENELTGFWDAPSTSTGSCLDSNVSSSLDVQPLLFK